MKMHDLKRWPRALAASSALMVHGCATPGPDPESAAVIASFNAEPWTRKDYQFVDNGVPVKIFHRPASGPNYGTILLAHGCGGVGHHSETVASRFAEQGFNAIVVDSLGYRGLGSICENNAIEGQDRLDEIYRVARWARTMPWHTGRVMLLGHSHGGKVAMAASRHGPEDGIDKAVAFYPYCFAEDRADARIPLQIHIGEKDDWTPAYLCRSVAGTVAGKNRNVAYFEYPNAYHGFDMKVDAKVTGIGQGNVVTTRTLRFNFNATMQAYLRTLKFFKEP